MKRDPGTPWRATPDSTGDFDELVVSDWFHLERMSERVWWVRIGQRSFNLLIRDKSCQVVDIVEQ